MNRPFRIILICLALLAGLALLLVAMRWDALVQHQLRPRLVEYLAERFDAEIVLKGLRLSGDRLVLEKARWRQANGTELVLPRAEIRFSLAGLRQYRVDSLRLEQPRLSWVPAEGPAGKLVLPPDLPFQIRQVKLNSGQAILHLPGRTLVADDLEMQGQLTEAINYEMSARIGPRAETLGVRGTGTWQDGLRLALKSIHFNDQQLLSRPLSLTFSGDRQALSGQLQFENFDDALLRRLLPLAAPAVGLPPLLHFRAATLQLAVDYGRDRPTLKLALPELQLSWRSLRLAASQVSLDLEPGPSGWQARGSALLPGGGKVQGTLDFSNTTIGAKAHLALAEMKPLLHTLAPEISLHMHGGLESDLHFRSGAEGWRLDGAFSGRGQEPGAEDYDLDITALSGDFTLQDDPSGWRLALNSRLSRRPLLKAGGTGRKISVSLASRQRSDLLRLLNKRLLPADLTRIDGLTAEAQLGPGADGSWRIKGHAGSRRLRIRELDLKGVAVDGVVDFRPDRIELSDLKAQADLQGHGARAHLRASGSGRWQQGRGQLLLEQLLLDESDYTSADQLSGMAGLKLTLGAAQIDLDRGLSFSAAGQLVPGELLHGSFYVDLGDLPAELELRGRLRDGSLWLDQLQLAFPDLLRLNLAGQVRAEGLRLSGRLQVPDTGLFLVEVQRRLEDLLPASVRGQAAGALDFSWTGALDSGGWWFNGLLQPRRLDFRRRDGSLAIIGLNGDLPLLLQSGRPQAAVEVTRAESHLDLQELKSTLLSGRDLHWRLQSLPNRVRWLDPLRFTLAGGELHLQDLDLGWPDFKPDFSGRIQVADVELESLTRALGWPLMQGALRADLGTLRYRDGTLKIDGQALVDLFGGRITIGNMQLAAPFSPYPGFLADIDFSGIDLYQATRTFEFGEMNGVVDGYIHDLRLFGATPSKFTARLESRSEGRRNISVKAINNLNTLSQGGLSSALSQGIYQFIDFYRYRKIGIACRLENDLFHLHGTASSSSDRMLINGGLLPPRIDMTVSSPTIPFREMVKRLQRIDRAGK